ncbi:hypothetical protein DdX_21755 [Ditylenchus destructor]|uniref:Uncharacterized protein n=1 Tax=Ditylenchus destructor TaxID=166010 RepID=A0AAD4MGT0_9BILA|nr:hypothetical protein DdX_21755 [Ditylenchus destructor]
MRSSTISLIVVYYTVSLLTCLIFVEKNIAITLKFNGHRLGTGTSADIEYGADFTAILTPKCAGNSVKIAGPTTDGQFTVTIPETVNDSDQIFITIAGESSKVKHTEKGESRRQNEKGYQVGRRANFVIPAKKLHDISGGDSAKYIYEKWMTLNLYASFRSVTATVHVNADFYNKVTMTMREDGGPAETA